MLVYLVLCLFLSSDTNKCDDKVIKTDEEWKQQLTEEQYNITRQKHTEPAGTGKYNDFYKDGLYKCVCCRNLLFRSEAKFKSGTGWPSFYGPADKCSLSEKIDTSYGMVRTEVLCRKCDAHLGHVFTDGPKPTGLRYCINSAALTFEPKR